MFTLMGELDPGTALLQRCRMCGEAELCQEVEGGGWGALLPVAGAHLGDGKSLCQTASRVQLISVSFRGAWS